MGRRSRGHDVPVLPAVLRRHRRTAAAIAFGAIFASTRGGWFWAQHYSEALVAPVWGLGVACWFGDLRARREGADLAVAA
jgi:hypothetical protein